MRVRFRPALWRVPGPPRLAAAGQSPSPGPEAVSWRRAHAGSGVTSGLILAYVEREAGRAAVLEMLSRAELADREQELRNENSWFSFEEKIRLWGAAEAVTGDPQVAVRVGESVLELRVGLALMRTLRALGSPDLVYRNVVRANSKFNWAHTLEAVTRENGRVQLRYRDVAGVGYHRYDCDYTIGLLRSVPRLFGMPSARVTHPQCGTRGGDCCAFEVTWSDGLRNLKRASLIAATLAVCLVGVGLLVDLALAGVGVGLCVAASGVAGAPGRFSCGGGSAPWRLPCGSGTSRPTRSSNRWRPYRPS